MATFYIENFGCRATQADAAGIAQQLLDRGYRRSPSLAADVVIVNSCTVTASADAQARQAVRRIHRDNPAARIIVTGCYAQRAPEELAQIEGVTWVVGNSHKPEIPGLVQRTLAAPDFVPLEQVTGGELISLARAPAKILTGNIFQQTARLGGLMAPVLGGDPDNVGAGGDRTRPTLKIQDGCNNRCAYCVIPFVRGRSRSLPPSQVLEEICRLAGSGFKEVVLSGINLGSYGRDLAPLVEFGELLRRILAETPLERLRISSIEPMDVTRDLVELVSSTRRIARHFHIPLQSGSDRILAAMHRWYRTGHYTRRVELIYEQLSGAAIGADLIVGFPGETEADHQATLHLVEQLPFTYLHVFAFSKRPGTKAAKMSGEVPPAVIKQRSQELRALAAKKNAAFRAAQVGARLRVLTLDRAGNGHTEALSDNYLKVRLPGAWPANKFLDVCITAVDGAYLIGRHAEPAADHPS
jgi:threonylcarbamoyladenosine tRNA methylthiotransferase MtaB